MVLRNFRSHFRERHGESNCGRWVPLILYDRFFVGGVGFLVIEEPQKTFCSFPAEKLAEDPEIDQKPPYDCIEQKKHAGYASSDPSNVAKSHRTGSDHRKGLDTVSQQTDKKETESFAAPAGAHVVC